MPYTKKSLTFNATAEQSLKFYKSGISIPFFKEKSSRQFLPFFGVDFFIGSNKPAKNAIFYFLEAAVIFQAFKRNVRI